jgi:tetratricopeptide (TPR) repeat protein
MNPDAEQGLAHWFEREGRRPEALSLYEQLARETPGSFDAWYGVAQLASVLGHRDEADAALARIQGLEPAHSDTAVLLALTALGAGCGPEAVAFAWRAQALDPPQRPGAGTPPAGRGARDEPSRRTPRGLSASSLRGEPLPLEL